MKQLNLKLSKIIKGKYYANVEITSSLVEIRVVHCYSRNNKHKNYLFIMARAILCNISTCRFSFNKFDCAPYRNKGTHSYLNTNTIHLKCVCSGNIVIRLTNYNLKCISNNWWRFDIGLLYYIQWFGLLSYVVVIGNLSYC